MTAHILEQIQHPLTGTWRAVRPPVERAIASGLTGLLAAACLDVAERIVRSAVEWQDALGVIVDPYAGHETSTCTPRFVGALGQLIGAGRCLDLVEPCIRGYEQCLGTIKQPRTSPEFAIKELVLAHQALRGAIEPARLRKWEDYWRTYDAEASFWVTVSKGDHNFSTFGLVGEFLRIREGLGGSTELVEGLLKRELGHIDEYGMYHDPGCPMTYHVVVLQQLAMLLMHGYEGPQARLVREAVRRGGLSSLLMQSCVGQAPFGGRSNQFHHMEAQSAALFEVCARLAREDGDEVLAGAYKGAARRGIALIRRWICDMEPFRHLKQSFHPRLDHGTDSGGPYSVYGILTASLCGIAHRYADESIPERPTPARVAGYVFTIHPDFAKIFAACGGWSIEIDTKANLTKDATGLGRVQHVSLPAEAILSGSIAGKPEYTSAFGLPQRNAAIGPQWVGPDGLIHRLADFSQQLATAELVVHEQSDGRVIFEVIYRGELIGVREVREQYELDPAGLRYSAQLKPQPAGVAYVLPIIETDGQVRSTVESADAALRVAYRGGTFTAGVQGGTIALTDERNTNRNATYRTGVAMMADEGYEVLYISQAPLSSDGSQ